MKYKLLVADDEPEIRVPAKEYFTLEGWEVTAVADGEAALAALDPHYDAVLLDVKMPRLDGYEALRRIQQRTDIPDLCVVMLTAFGEVQRAVASVRSRAYTYLEKPVEMDVLAGTIEAGIAWQRAHALRRKVLAGVSVPEARESVVSLINRTIRPKVFILLLNEAGEQAAHGLDPATRAPITLEVVIRGQLGRPLGRMFLGLDEDERVNRSWEEIVNYLADLLALAIELEEIKRERERVNELRTTETILVALRDRIADPAQTVQGALSAWTAKLSSVELPGDLQRDIAVLNSRITRQLARLRESCDFLSRVPIAAPRLQSIDLISAVNLVLDKFENQHQAASLTFRFLPEELLLVCNADPSGIQFVVNAMLRNAMDAIEERRRRILDPDRSRILEPNEIEVRVHSLNQSAEVRIRDTGVGIPDEDRPKIFRPMFTTKARADTHGFELYSARQIVLAHGGDIGFDSEDGVGSTFWFQIPKDR